jgi:hypothetical protein
LNILFSIHPSFSLRKPAPKPWKWLACYRHS